MRITIFVLAGLFSLAACAQPATPLKPSAPPDSVQHTAKTPATPVAKTGGFDQTLSLQGISFHVTGANAGSVNKLRIVPKGLKSDNKPIEKEIDGTVTGAEVADLNADGSPEIYVYATSAGSGSYGSLVAYAANKGKSLSEIYLPSLQDDAKAAKGYMGHDEFRVVENGLVRRFPVYGDKDTNAQPTGGTRQIQYKLKAGEAGWVLKPGRIDNF
ncbi:MAG: PliI family lysozyme inhibitor of I-type lysozyme [Proteobacteria bacterium]|nr:PliI family lysozyme inhibitor of I-type lysozyme [Pseudomonadota bacterium]